MEPKGCLASPVETQLGQLAVSFRAAGRRGSLLGLPKPILSSLVSKNPFRMGSTSGFYSQKVRIVSNLGIFYRFSANCRDKISHPLKSISQNFMYE